ncbi:hypothetical protein COJ96_10970 [Bacillus sp. AFS073361]|uniref:hypothetical protein n=1 Tax=Bacillus sp. AFS073361 TaxID=2033511 RepID=UPI000BF94A51|nr:hypothetical protein [Bacillus sp. AFS073361]PFP29418.1 hypothetical protein COJ96_10970 [Bacillus sp. AFS073361]
MKVVTYDKRSNVVFGVFPEVFSPEIDRENGIIFHENGTFHRINSDKYGFLILDDYVPVRPGDTITDKHREMDLTHKYEGFKLNDIGDAIKAMGKEVAEEIKDLFGKKGDENDG